MCVTQFIQFITNLLYYHSGRDVSITVSYLDIELVVTVNKNIIEIEVFTRNIQLECNRDVCIWYSVDSLGIYTVVGNSITYTIPYITIENNKQYVLSTQDNSGLFVPAASIRIRPIGMLFNFFKININDGTTYIVADIVVQIFNEILGTGQIIFNIKLHLYKPRFLVLIISLT